MKNPTAHDTTADDHGPRGDAGHAAPADRCPDHDGSTTERHPSGRSHDRGDDRPGDPASDHHDRTDAMQS